METVETQDVETSTTENKEGSNVDTPATEKKVDKAEPYKSFSSKEEFDKHSAGILNSAKNKAEKELLALLGLKPDEKDKLAKFKEAYDSTLSESEKQAKKLEDLNSEVAELKRQLDESNAIILALTKFTGKESTDVDKMVRMARGLVDSETTMEQALNQVIEMMGGKDKNTKPKGNPLNEPTSKIEENPFSKENFNLTKQGELMKSDRQKAREMYTKATGKAPSW